MRGKLERLYECHDLHFVTFSCYHRQPKLDTASRKDLFLSVLEEVRERYRFRVIGHVVMPEHVHLLLSQPEIGTPSTVMQVLKQTASRRVESDPEHGLWQRRFYDFNVYTERKRREKIRYMHETPVARGLARKPEDWQWSSSQYYAFGHPTPVTIDSSWLNQWRPDSSQR